MSHLTNPLATAAQLARCQARAATAGVLPGPAVPGARPPGALPGMLLDAVFFATQRLTQAAGLLLELPQSTTARANVLLARYWVQVPGWLGEGVGGGEDEGEEDEGDDIGDDRPDYRHVSAAAVFLVAKMGPLPRSARDVANVYHFLAGPGATASGDASPTPPPSATAAASDTDYARFHTHVLACETRLLAALAFETHVALPHPLAVTYLQALDFLGVGGGGGGTAGGGTAGGGAVSADMLAHRTLQYLNTALLSPQLLYATHQPHELAVAALYSAARDLGVPLPDAAGPWWEVFDVDRETLGFLAVALRSLAAWAATARAQLSSPDRLDALGALVTRPAVAAEAAWLAAHRLVE